MEIYSHFNPLKPDHPLVCDHTPCPFCTEPFEEGDEIVAITGAPSDDQERAKMDAGRPYIAMSAIAHRACGPQDS